MKKQVVVLDFDGTITDAEEEGKPFVSGFKEDLCLLLAQRPDELLPIVLSAEDEITANPSQNGWVRDGLIVAPVTADPYLRMQAVARLVFDHFSAFADQSDRQRLLDFLYQRNYALSGVSFRDSAGDMLVQLCANAAIEVYIVTNSGTDAVGKKIAILSRSNDTLAQLSARVIGGARKFLVRERPKHVAETLTLPGLSRPVYLRRGAYYDVLQRLCARHAVGWKNLAVIGDIFELDLALPFALGARIGLVRNQFTPQYELDFIAANPKQAVVINSLYDIISFVSGESG